MLPLVPLLLSLVLRWVLLLLSLELLFPWQRSLLLRLRLLRRARHRRAVLWLLLLLLRLWHGLHRRAVLWLLLLLLRLWHGLHRRAVLWLLLLLLLLLLL